MILLSDVYLKPYSDTSSHNEKLKSLSRYRFTKIHECAKLKNSISRLVYILFQKLEKLVTTLHMPSIYRLLEEYPEASYIASSHLSKLTNLLNENSHGHYNVILRLSLEILLVTP